MLKLFGFIFLIALSTSALGQQVESANVHDDNHYIALGAQVTHVEGLSSAVNAEKVEVKEEPKKEEVEKPLEEVENPSEGISASVNPY
jgi:hypothetical protein